MTPFSLFDNIDSGDMLNTILVVIIFCLICLVVLRFRAESNTIRQLLNLSPREFFYVKTLTIDRPSIDEYPIEVWD